MALTPSQKVQFAFRLRMAAKNALDCFHEHNVELFSAGVVV